MKLRGVTWDDVRGYNPLIEAARVYAKTHPGIEIEWDKRSLLQFGAYPIEKLADTYDLLVIDHPFVGTAAATGCLIPLETVIPAPFLSEQQSQSVGASYRSYTYDGHQWALPIDVAAQVSAFRPDLLDAVPGTWGDVLTLARTSGRNGRPRVGMPLSAVDAICAFISLCANWGDPPGRDAHHFVRRETGRRVFTWLRDLVEVAHPASLASNPPTTLDLMAETDEIAYVPLLFGYSNYARHGYRSHLVRYANIPPGECGSAGAILGGAGLAISSSCDSPDEAATYAQWMADPEVQCGLFFAAGGQPGNRLAWLDPEINRQANCFFLDTLETADHAYVRPRYAGFLDFQSAAGEAIHRFLSGGGEIDATLDEIETIWRETHHVPSTK